MLPFKTDLEALIYIGLVIIICFSISKLVSSTLNKIDRLNRTQKVVPVFIIELFSLVLIIYLIIEGLPIIRSIDQEYIAILITLVSTAIAFATSDVFSNLISGIILLIIDPFDLGDIIEIKGDLGIVRSIKLTRTLIETFDNILIEKSNNELLSSNITNYSIELEKMKKTNEFKNDLMNKSSKILKKKKSSIEEDKSIQEILNSLFKLKNSKKIHNFFFDMDFSYEGFDEKLQRVDKIIGKYKSNFKSKPSYHILSFGGYITVRFRILTNDAEKIFEYQPKLAEDLSRIILE